MDQKTWKKFWSASTLSSFTFGSTIGTQRPEKGHQTKTKAAIGSILRDRALFKCLNGFEDIFPLFPVSWCWNRVFKISFTFCADIVRNAISQGIGSEWVWSAIVPSLGADIAPLASLEAITKKIIIINKYPWPHFKQSPRKSSSSTNSLGLTSSDHQENHQQRIFLPNSCHLQWIKYDHMIHSLIRWWNSGRKLSVRKGHAWSFPLLPLPETNIFNFPASNTFQRYLGDIIATTDHNYLQSDHLKPG